MYVMLGLFVCFFFFNDTATTEIYTLSLHDALPICATPSGSTAYNLSNGGPVLVRGIDALAATFIAPHSLHARPLVVPRGLTVTVRNDTVDVAAAVLVDGHQVGEVAPGADISIYLCEQRTLLATLPETTFFGRYRET